MAFCTKMEGLLCRWALAMEEYNFQIVYRKGTLNGNADALSRRPNPISTPVTMTSTTKQIIDVQQAKQNVIMHWSTQLASKLLLQ